MKPQNTDLQEPLSNLTNLSFQIILIRFCNSVDLIAPFVTFIATVMKSKFRFCFLRRIIITKDKCNYHGCQAGEGSPFVVYSRSDMNADYGNYRFCKTGIGICSSAFSRLIYAGA
jgi:hypothetical protein